MMPGTVKTYMFHVPPDSPVKYGPPSFRPTIRVDGKYVAFSSSAFSHRTLICLRGRVASFILHESRTLVGWSARPAHGF